MLAHHNQHDVPVDQSIHPQAWFIDMLALDGELQPGMNSKLCPVIHIQRANNQSDNQGSDHSEGHLFMQSDQQVNKPFETYPSVSADEVFISIQDFQTCSVAQSIKQSAQSLSKEQCIQYLASALFALHQSVNRPTHLAQELQKSTDRCRDLEKRHESHLGTIEQLHNKVNKLESSIQAKTDKFKSLKSKNELLSSNIDMLKATIEPQQSKIVNLENHVKQVQSILQSNAKMFDRKINEMKDMHESRKKTITDLEEQVKQLKQQIQQFEATILSKNRSLVVANSKIEHIVNHAVRQNISKFEKDVALFKQTADQKDRTINQLTDEVTELISVVKSLRAIICDLQSVKLSQVQTSSRAKQEIADLELAPAQLTTSVNRTTHDDQTDEKSKHRVAVTCNGNSAQLVHSAAIPIGIR